MRILDTIWFTTSQGLSVGFVLIAPEVGGRKIYCGLASGVNEEKDALAIAQFGARVPINEMIAFFKAGLD